MATRVARMNQHFLSLRLLYPGNLKRFKICFYHFPLSLTLTSPRSNSLSHSTVTPLS